MQACSDFRWCSRLDFRTFLLPSSFRRPSHQRDKASENSQLTAGPISPPKYWQKECSEPACHTHGPKLDTLEGGAVAGRRKNSQHISRYRGGKITHETPTMKRFFALNSGQLGKRYETKIQQSTNTTSQSTPWARLLAMLERLGCCGSLSITSCQQPILCVFSHG